VLLHREKEVDHLTTYKDNNVGETRKNEDCRNTVGKKRRKGGGQVARNLTSKFK